MALTLYRRDAASVFDLLGRGETDLTAALGWTLSQSPALMRAVWTRLRMPGDPADVTADLEVTARAEHDGRTDLELTVAPISKVIVEAKKSWLLPGEAQLRKYVSRFSDVEQALIVTLSDASATWAAHSLPREVDGVPVRHLPWDDVRTDIRTATAAARDHTERLWLRQLAAYLQGATAMRDPAEAWVYVVSVSPTFPGGGGPRSFRDFVRTERAYFHAFGPDHGKTWPKRPPVFMGFRWEGAVRQVNRVVTSDVIPTLQARWPDIPVTEDTARPHAVYGLGLDIPIEPIPTTGVFRARRLWALLDQLLTAPTLIDAERESKRITQPGPATH